MNLLGALFNPLASALGFGQNGFMANASGNNSEDASSNLFSTVGDFFTGGAVSANKETAKNNEWQRKFSEEDTAYQRAFNEEQRDYERAWAQQQFDYQKSIDQWNQDYQMNQQQYMSQDASKAGLNPMSANGQPGLISSGAMTPSANSAPTKGTQAALQNFATYTPVISTIFGLLNQQKQTEIADFNAETNRLGAIGNLYKIGLDGTGQPTDNIFSAQNRALYDSIVAGTNNTNKDTELKGSQKKKVDQETSNLQKSREYIIQQIASLANENSLFNTRKALLEEELQKSRDYNSSNALRDRLLRYQGSSALYDYKNKRKSFNWLDTLNEENVSNSRSSRSINESRLQMDRERQDSESTRWLVDTILRVFGSLL